MQENTKKDLSINERFFKFLEIQGVSRYAFSKKTGVSEAVLSNAAKMKSKLSIDIVQAMLNNYKVNPLWLIANKGEMMLPERKMSPEAIEYNEKRRRKDPSPNKDEEHAVIEPTGAYKIQGDSTLELERANRRLKSEIKLLKTKLEVVREKLEERSEEVILLQKKLLEQQTSVATKKGV